MARRRSKARDRKPKKRKRKKKLTLEEMLARVPDADYVNTKQARRVFNDCTDVTVYRYVQQGKLTKKTRFGGAASYYSREEVIALVRAHFTPCPASTESGEDDAVESEKKQGKPKRRVRSKAKGNRK